MQAEVERPAQARHSVARVGVALALALAVAFAFNPALPLEWAYDAPLPDGATLWLIEVAQSYRATAERLGLDALNLWAEAQIDALRHR
ncbi:MAG: hypothetical protein AAGC92_14805 [Pseudomonadota bacterium]